MILLFSSRLSLGSIRKLSTASEGHFIEIKERVTLDFYMDDVLLSDEFLVVPGLSEESIIGAATLQKWDSQPAMIKLRSHRSHTVFK